MYKFEIFRDAQGQFRFNLRAPNGEVMLASEGYTTKASAQAAIESIKANAAGASTVDKTSMTA